jgi:hypothetical protein
MWPLMKRHGDMILICMRFVQEEAFNDFVTRSAYPALAMVAKPSHAHAPPRQQSAPKDSKSFLRRIMLIHDIADLSTRSGGSFDDKYGSGSGFGQHRKAPTTLASMLPRFTDPVIGQSVDANHHRRWDSGRNSLKLLVAECYMCL